MSTEGTFSTNSLGLRAPEFTLKDLAANPRSILCVGGSTTECYYVTDEASYPWRLGEILEDRLGEPVLVGNAGRGGHITAHHTHQLRHYRPAERFSCIVVLCGWNDLATMLYGDWNARVRTVREEALVRSVTYRDYWAPHTAWYRHTVTWRMAETILLDRQPHEPEGWNLAFQDPFADWVAERRQHRAALLARNPVSEIPPDFGAILDQYRRNLDELIASVPAGSTPILMTQPTLFRPGLSPDLEALTWSAGEDKAHTAEAWFQMISRFNEILRQCCREKGDRVIDLAASLPADTTVFYDDCHFNEPGCEQVAALVAAETENLFRQLKRSAPDP